MRCFLCFWAATTASVKQGIWQHHTATTADNRTKHAVPPAHASAPHADYVCLLDMPMACVCVSHLQQYKWHEPSREAIEGAFDKLLQVRERQGLYREQPWDQSTPLCLEAT